MKKGYQKEDILNLNAYDEGVRKGVDVALKSERLDIKKQNPYNPFFSSKSCISFSMGLRVGFKMGISQREYNRLRKLQKIGKTIDLFRER